MQVYLEDRYVGELSAMVYPGLRFVTMFEMPEAIGLRETAVPIHERTVVRREFKVVERGASHTIDQFSLDRRRDNGAGEIEQIRRQLNIPADAQFHSDVDHVSGRMLFRWRWQTLRVSLEEYEWLFDQPTFEPA